jgi:3-phosphoshikimate 1-carboxyvinyltransferase
MDAITLSKPDRSLRGTLALNGSKSISNRALIALALAGTDADAWLSNRSTSKDTVTLQALLAHTGDTFDAGDAGTTFRFLAAYLTTKPGQQILTGSARMLERPIGPLVDALRSLGADIEYLGQEGYPPLRIGTSTATTNRRIGVAANISSQFLSALLLIGPYLPGGLELVPEGPLVSRPYLDMTVKMMQYFGADVQWQGDALLVAPGVYQPRPLAVEADWSGASYWYAMAVFADDLHLRLEGCHAESWQGDAALVRMMQKFGIQSTFEKNTLVLTKTGQPARPIFEQDFLECPDIAQTLAVVCGGTGVTGIFSGLETLSIKETDRIAALKAELAKVDVSFAKLPKHMSQRQPDKTFYQVLGKAHWHNPPVFATYGDHRMAMAFAALAFLGDVVIEHPKVVAKSYPEFWQHLESVGFNITVQEP